MDTRLTPAALAREIAKGIQVKSKNTNEPPKGSAEVWLDAALETLLESGVDSVRILNLSKRLKLSRTSFYWFFEDRSALLESLLNRWRNKNTSAIIDRATAYAESMPEAILNLFDCWLDPRLFDARLEFSIRTWAQQSEEVRNEVERADEIRMNAIRDMFIHFNYQDVSADVRARAIYLTQIGYITMQTRESIGTRLKRIPTYVEVFAGRMPTRSEMDRFVARHSQRLEHA